MLRQGVGLLPGLSTLLLVVGGRNTLENLQVLHSGGTTGGLVGNHAADSLVEDAGWG